MQYEVAVRTLCEFTAKQGDLDMRFTPSPSAVEGMNGHRLLASRRGPGYKTELTLSGECGSLHVRGRADGYDPREKRLEEFKTHRGDLARMPANHRALHWAQLRIYGCLLCRELGLQELNLALVYLDIATGNETALLEVATAKQLERHFELHCERFAGWAESEAAHREKRDGALRQLQFPHAQFHAGQRDLAAAVYRLARRSGALLAQAPTGSGKTAGTLFPALKAMPDANIDKVFYLVAKTSGRALALNALAGMQAGAQAPLRVVELVARSKACEYPGSPCDGAACPLARSFYDRLPAARAAAMEVSVLDRAAARRIGLDHGVCPYYLSQEAARWSDVVVGDYNYYFDRTGLLFGWTVTHQWRVCLLVDEAHNLVERARGMFTASLDSNRLDDLTRRAPARVRGALQEVGRTWTRINAAQSAPTALHDELPTRLLDAVERSIAACTDHFTSESGPPELLDFMFAALEFCRLAAEFDSHSVFEVTQTVAANALTVHNLVPAKFLAPRFAAAHATVLFSATLAPHIFYRDVLGLPATTGFLDVRSSFSSEQLAVTVVSSISTRFRDRQRSLAPIADLIGRQHAAQPGNYLVFCSSFEYLEQLRARVMLRCPGIPVWHQEPGMSEPERQMFLERFQPAGTGIGFAVLGGAFGEGIDLPGTRLVGAFVATLGLPQMNRVNEQMQHRMQVMFGAGYEYTYLYPGIRKVVQAAGRVIRTSADRGVLFLIDDRFTAPNVLELLPVWWENRRIA